MFLYIKVVIFLFIFSSKVLAISPGQIFWEITKPGESNPNYLMGTIHDIIIDKDSLPPELLVALEHSRVGLFEIVSGEQIEKELKEARKKVIWLPDGEYLSLYIGEDRSQRIFSALQVAFSQMSQHITSALFEAWAELGLDMKSYEEFNRLRPYEVFFIIHYITLLKEWSKPSVLQRDDLVERTSIYKSEPEAKQCFSHQNKMDVYMKKTLSCMGKPIRSLETLESHKLVLAVTRDRIIAVKIIRDFEWLVPRLEGQPVEETIALYGAWNVFLGELKGKLFNSIEDSYYLNQPIDTDHLIVDVVQTVSDFLMRNQCSLPPFSLVDQYVRRVFNYNYLRNQVMIEGKQMEEKTEEQFVYLIDEINRKQNEIFSLCYPGYRWPEDQEKRVARHNQEQLKFIKDDLQLMILSRDPVLTKGILPYFKEGGAFVAVGYKHLRGVLRELSLQGYEVTPIRFSAPLDIVSTPSVYQ